MKWTNIKIDFQSIRFKLWATFIAFALILLALIWCLQVVFLRTYYEGMKKIETSNVATEIQSQFSATDEGLVNLNQKIHSIAATNDMTIIVMNATDGSLVINSDSMDGRIGLSRYSGDMDELYLRLTNSKFDSVTKTSRQGVKNRMMGYACFLTGQTQADYQNRYVLFVFSPLFPVKSTISILQSQLTYITIIAILLALTLSAFLADRISKPIKNITRSAARMGQGEYNIKFQGGAYSEINELAETLTQAEMDLERTDIYQKDLIANVSHDLRTPLTMIKSYAEMIRDLSGDNPEKRNNHLGVIIDETNRLNSLVNDMLNLSRMQSQKIVLEREVFDLRQATDQIIASYDILQENEGYHIQYQADKNAFWVDGDESKLKQVMINLLNNAVKYCGEDKEIIVRLKKTGKSVRFSVTDHGQGIAPSELAHVWERYYKSSTHHVRPTEGSGLGLSIVKEILQLHNAEFSAESTVGKGSTFWFELPLQRRK